MNVYTKLGATIITFIVIMIVGLVVMYGMHKPTVGKWIFVSMFVPVVVFVASFGTGSEYEHHQRQLHNGVFRI